MKILWLVSWYPSDIKPFNGDFIQRHAQAASQYNDIEVIFVEKDSEGLTTVELKKQEKVTGRLTERWVYYYVPEKNKFLNKLISLQRYLRLYQQEVDNYVERNGKPDFIHVHVAMRAGLIALWAKRKYGIPFLVSEHWTGYLPNAHENLFTFPFYYRRANKRIIQSALGLSAVSRYLGEKIRSLRSVKAYTVIPNAVNRDVFHPVSQTPNRFARFIHISTLSYQKNPEAILEAFAIVKTWNYDFELSIVGPKKESIKTLASSYNLNRHVRFLDEVPQKDLAQYIQLSDALILYSRYETFGCVLIEANACGVPVIVSELEVFKEIIQESFNGITAKVESPPNLAEKIIWFIENRSSFDGPRIATTTSEKYSFDIIGKMFDDWYRSFMK